MFSGDSIVEQATLASIKMCVRRVLADRFRGQVVYRFGFGKQRIRAHLVRAHEQKE